MKLNLKIKRQLSPSEPSFWENFTLTSFHGQTLTDALLELRSRPVNREGQVVPPVVWPWAEADPWHSQDAVLVNGEPRLLSLTSVQDLPQPITLEPLSSFAVVRDLVVEVDLMLEAAQRLSPWMELDAYTPRAVERQKQALPVDLLSCTQCRLCEEACPQTHQDTAFIGPRVMLETHRRQGSPNGFIDAESRLESLQESWGVGLCDNSQLCVKACPQGIDLVSAIARLKRQLYQGSSSS